MSWSMRMDGVSEECLSSLLSQQRAVQGIDIIWESVGGSMFRTCTKALGQGGRLIVIGMMSQYADGWGASEVPGPVTLSSSVLAGCGGGDCLHGLQQEAMCTLLLWLLDAGPQVLSQVRHLGVFPRTQRQRSLPSSDMINRSWHSPAGAACLWRTLQHCRMIAGDWALSRLSL